MKLNAIADIESTTALSLWLPGFCETGSQNVAPILGASRFGGRFGFNPFELYRDGVISNPNAFVFGQVGKGKSALLKSYLARMFLLGYPSVVFDPKGEYGALARFFGFDPIDYLASKRGVNPFVEVEGAPNGLLARELNSEMATYVISVALGRRPTEIEHLAISEALNEITRGVDFFKLRSCLEKIDRSGGPTTWRGSYSIGSLASLLAVLDSLIESGLVAQSESSFDLGKVLGKSILVFDLSGLFGSGRYPLVVALLLGALRAHKMTRDLPPLIIAIDEIWALMSDSNIASWLGSYWKLSRGIGIANIGVSHRLSDFSGGDDVGAHLKSQSLNSSTNYSNGPNRTVISEINRGLGMINDTETIVSFALEVDEAHHLCSAFGFSLEVAPLLRQLRKGSALWKIGERNLLVDHYLTSIETALFNTDAPLLGRGARARPN
ncbi:helicase HerA domain-containing protein [Acidithrix ferrooxidans]|uniref:AAA-like domain protein n=1 Tax=Acidithrix ferrooxidans TaxID=1280514 RepID=A0A0D8HJ37_9ACTN|nr:DUF87 domain-containing protein [Acidithrix ferrooxidans]KJF17933.1 AAA-like domain protein [Acidithrix ferrooxidans]